MQEIIKLTAEVEAATIRLGNAVGIIEKECAENILTTLRQQLNHEIHRYERKK